VSEDDDLPKPKPKMGRPRSANPRKPKKKSTAAFADDPTEPDRCHAKNRQGKRCGMRCVVNRKVCRLHGGMAGRPPKHGRFSGAMGRLNQAYEAALQDKEGLLDLSETLAVLETVVKEHMRRATEKEDTPEFRAKALALYKEARRAKDADVAAARLAELGRLLEKGAGEDGVLEQLASAVERMAKRQEQVWKIRLSSAQSINSADLVILLTKMASIIADECNPEDAKVVLRRIDLELLGESAEVRNLPLRDK
jgi:hypothetical protein